MYSPEALTKIAVWRQKASDGTITDAELAEAVSILRDERYAASKSAASRRSAAKGQVHDAETLLSELEGL